MTHAVIASPQDLGRIVRRVRTERGLSQRELADLLGVSQRYLYELEVGKPKRADEGFFLLIAKLGIALRAEVADG